MKVTIQQPCDKINWTKMSNIQKGKFCTICSKNVIDFSAMKDEEIIYYLNNSEESICARLNQNQMNRILSINRPLQIKHWTKIAALFAITTLPVATYANNNNSISIVQELNFNKHLNIPNSSIEKLDSIPKIIKGKVVEKGWEKGVQTSVLVKGTSIKVDTDSLGNFELQIPSNYIQEEIVLIIESAGLEDDTEYILQISDLPKENIVIEKNPMMIGKVIIIKKKRWWQFWKKSYKDNR